jgi:hypothetical protein
MSIVELMYEYMQVEIERWPAAAVGQGGFQRRDGSSLQEKDSEIIFGVRRGRKLSYTNSACMPGETREIFLGLPLV